MDPEKAARREAVLQRVQQILLAVAEDLADALVSTTDEDTKAKLAGAVHRITRGVRQSVYLEARLEREQAEVRTAEAERARKDASDQVTRRKDQAKARVTRLVWDEYDQDDSEEFDAGDRLIDRAEAWLAEAAEAQGFLEAPLEGLVAALCAYLDLEPDEAACAPMPALGAESPHRGPADSS